MNLTRPRLPQLSDAELKDLPPAFAEYQRALSRALHEADDANLKALAELDAAVQALTP